MERRCPILRASAVPPARQKAEISASGLGGLRQDPDQPVLRERTGGPSAPPVGLQPAMRRLMMEVLGIEERHRDVDIEQRDLAHVSSRKRFTRSMVGCRLPGGRRGMRGTPLRTARADRRWSPLRARSESTLPIVDRRLAASSLAACSTSSSMSTVVRMTVESRITHQTSMRVRRGGVPPHAAANKSDKSSGSPALRNLVALCLETRIARRAPDPG